MSHQIIGVVVAILLGVILFSVTQSVLVATSTVGWTGLQVTLAFLLPTLALITIVILIFKTIGERSGA